MKVVRVRRVVNNNHIGHRAAEQGKILDVAALIRKAVVTVESEGDQPVLVYRVNEWIGVDGHRSCVNDELVDEGQPLQKEGNSRSDEHIYLNGTTFDDDAHLKVSFSSCFASLKLRDRELAMDQCLIQIKHKSLAASVLRLLLRDHSVLSRARFLSETVGSVQLLNHFFCEVELLLQQLSCGLCCHLILLLSSLLLLLLHHLLLLQVDLLLLLLRILVLLVGLLLGTYVLPGELSWALLQLVH